MRFESSFEGGQLRRVQALVDPFRPGGEAYANYVFLPLNL